MTWSRIHSAPLRVLPKPRPASSSQVRQSPFGACWLGRPHQPQSCSITSSSRSLVCLRNAASCSGGSDASNSAHETFSDSANLDLDRITVRHTGVFVGAGFAPAAARLHPEDRGSDAGALVFECRFAGAAVALSSFKYPLCCRLAGSVRRRGVSEPARDEIKFHPASQGSGGTHYQPRLGRLWLHKLARASGWKPLAPSRLECQRRRENASTGRSKTASRM